MLFPGPIYGEGYRELLAHALAYIHATEVGGTHPALVEAMGYGNCVVVNDTPENREVAGDSAVYFRADTPPTLSSRARMGRAPSCQSGSVPHYGRGAGGAAFQLGDGYRRLRALFRRLVEQR